MLFFLTILTSTQFIVQSFNKLSWIAKNDALLFTGNQNENTGTSSKSVLGPNSSGVLKVRCCPSVHFNPKHTAHCGKQLSRFLRMLKLVFRRLHTTVIFKYHAHDFTVSVISSFPTPLSYGTTVFNVIWLCPTHMCTYSSQSANVDHVYLWQLF